jgi:hypothetical protein
MILKNYLNQSMDIGYSMHPAYDIGTGKGLVVSDLAKMINPNIEIREGHECEADDNTADISLMQELGWYPKEPDAAKFIKSIYNT